MLLKTQAQMIISSTVTQALLNFCTVQNQQQLCSTIAKVLFASGEHQRKINLKSAKIKKNSEDSLSCKGNEFGSIRQIQLNVQS